MQLAGCEAVWSQAPAPARALLSGCFLFACGGGGSLVDGWAQVVASAISCTMRHFAVVVLTDVGFH